MSHKTKFQHHKIQLEAIRLATNNFSDDNYIGYGGYGKVYKGELVHSTGKTVVAFKRLDRAMGQGNSEFWKEIMMLSLYKHENIVSLLGYCDDNYEKILVYEYASKRSLDCYLSNGDLTWVQRLKICVGAACGLAYLHTPAKTQLRIVHRDIKSSNILLDDNWNAKISDFGLSKFAPANNQFTFLVSNPAGTIGYIDPMYLETGLLTKESDVYSFGVVLFEVLCGRLCFGNENLQPLIGLVREYYEQNKIRELVDSNIKNEIKETALKLFADIAYQCLKGRREERPQMTQIMSALETALDSQEKANGKIAIHEAGILNVNALNMTDFRSKNPLDGSNYYFVLAIDGQGRLLKVEWKEESTLYMKDVRFKDVDRQLLHIYVNEIVSVQKHRWVGWASLDFTHLTPEPEIHFLDVLDQHKVIICNLKIKISYKPTYIEDEIMCSVPKALMWTHKVGGLLVVIIQTAHLASVYSNTSPSVSLLFLDKLRKTVSISNTNYPKWVQEFTFALGKPPTYEKLHLEVINNSWTGLIPGKGTIGSVDISLGDVVKRKWTNTIYTLEPYYFADDGPVINKLQVELHWRTPD